ncbi:hypothetical protein DFH09DRAFT_1103929 [Mycena vulgaris]|nr:hypothetical protein DFH09DRAFT_1103929 [Mycena vulgaris]
MPAGAACNYFGGLPPKLPPCEGLARLRELRASYGATSSRPLTTGVRLPSKPAWICEWPASGGHKQIPELQKNEVEEEIIAAFWGARATSPKKCPTFSNFGTYRRRSSPTFGWLLAAAWIV